MKFIGSAVNKFIKLQTSSSIILFTFSILAIILANSGYGYYYNELWNHKFSIGFTDTKFYLSKSLILWINDGLMAIFFFVIGLEVKREIVVGELTTLRKASLPIFAAIGGMLFPVIIFLLLNNNQIGSEGWGVPMATDIAFTLGILNLLGKRVPLGLKIFLTAFAIVDDLGAVLIIAFFYSATIQWILIGFSALLLIVLYYFSYKQMYNKYIYFIIGVVVWVLFLKSGIHPTIAGVLMAFSIPLHRKVSDENYAQSIFEQINLFKSQENPSAVLINKNQLTAVDEIENISKQVNSPLQHLEHILHGWVSFLIMPIFAFANAGVLLDFSGSSDVGHITINTAGALVFGNFLGIFLLSYLGIKLKLADLPDGVQWKHLIGISLLGGLGFTMSLFISNLAYSDADLLAASKMGILMGSLIAGVLGYLVLRFTLNKKTA